MPPRLNRAPGQVHNEAKQLKEQRIREEQERKQEKENKRLARNSHVKKVIEETGFGGKGQPTNKYKAEEQKQKEKEDKQREREENRKFQ